MVWINFEEMLSLLFAIQYYWDFICIGGGGDVGIWDPFQTDLTKLCSYIKVSGYICHHDLSFPFQENLELPL